MTTLSPAQEIDWWKGDFDSALAQAAEVESKQVLLYFWSDGDENCVAMFNETISDKAVIQALGKFVCLDCDEKKPQGKAVFDRFHIRQVPTVMVVSAAGEIVDAVGGYMAVRPFLDEVARIAKGEGTVAALREQAKARAGDPAAQLQLAKKLRTIGLHEEATKMIDAIAGADPKFKAEATAEAELLRLFEAAFGGGAAPADVDLGPIENFLIKAKHDRVRFLGYDRIAATEYARGDLEAAIKTVAKAFKHAPDDEILDWGRGVGAKAYLEREKLDRRALKLALDITTATLAAAEREREKRGDAFLADVLYLHASMQIANSKRKPGFASLERAIELDPKNENLKAALKSYREGAK